MCNGNRGIRHKAVRPAHDFRDMCIVSLLSLMFNERRAAAHWRHIDREAIGGRLIRSGPPPVTSFSKAGNNAEALICGPNKGEADADIAVRHNTPQQLAGAPSLLLSPLV